MAIDSTQLQQVRILVRTNHAVALPARTSKSRALSDNFTARYNSVDAVEPEQADPQNPQDDTASSVVYVHRELSADQPESQSQADAEREAPTATSPALVATESAELSMRIARACLHDEEASLMTTHLAALVARFCNAPAVSAGGIWELQVEINPKILAETTLRLQLSAFRLSLRFESMDPRSKRLIYENSKELSSRLAMLLGGQIDVDISCW